MERENRVLKGENTELRRGGDSAGRVVVTLREVVSAVAKAEGCDKAKGMLSKGWCPEDRRK